VIIFDLQHNSAVFDIPDESVEVERRQGISVEVVELRSVGREGNAHDAQVGALGVVVAVEVGLESVGHEPQRALVVDGDVRNELQALLINSEDPLETSVGVPGSDGGLRDWAEVDFTVGISEETGALGSLITDHDHWQRRNARVLQGIGGHCVQSASGQRVVVEHAFGAQVRNGHSDYTVLEVEGLAGDIVGSLTRVGHQRLVLKAPSQIASKVVDDKAGSGSIRDVNEHVLTIADGGELFIKSKGSQQRTLTKNLKHIFLIMSTRRKNLSQFKILMVFKNKKLAKKLLHFKIIIFFSIIYSILCVIKGYSQMSYLRGESNAADGKASLQIKSDETRRARIDGVAIQGGQNSRVEGPQTSTAVNAGAENGHQTTAVVQVSLLPRPVGEGKQRLVFDGNSIIGHPGEGGWDTFARAGKGKEDAVMSDLDSSENSIFGNGALRVDSSKVKIGPPGHLVDWGTSAATLGRSKP